MSATPTIWIVDDDRSIRWVVERALTNASYACETFESADLMFEALRTDAPAVVVSDIRMPGTDGIKLLGQLRESHPHVPVIITTAHSDLDSAVVSYEEGAFEYLPKPFDVDEMVATVAQALAQRQAQTSDNLTPEDSNSSARDNWQCPGNAGGFSGYWSFGAKPHYRADQR